MKKKGLTLIELIATMAIAAIVFAMVSNIMVYGVKSYKDGSRKGDLQNKAIVDFAKLENQIRSASYATTENNYIREVMPINDNEKPLVYVEPVDSPNAPFALLMGNVAGKQVLTKVQLEKQTQTKSVTYLYDDFSQKRSFIIEALELIWNAIKRFLRLPSITELRISDYEIEVSKEYDIYRLFKDTSGNIHAYAVDKSQHKNWIIDLKQKSGNVTKDSYIEKSRTNLGGDVKVEDHVIFIRVTDENNKSFETAISTKSVGGD